MVCNKYFPPTLLLIFYSSTAAVCTQCDISSLMLSNFLWGNMRSPKQLLSWLQEDNTTMLKKYCYHQIFLPQVSLFSDKAFLPLIKTLFSINYYRFHTGTFFVEFVGILITYSLGVGQIIHSFSFLSPLSLPSLLSLDYIKIFVKLVVCLY